MIHLNTILATILLPVLCGLTGCGAPKLQQTWPANDQVMVVEHGKREVLVRIEISWPAFPSGYPMQFVNESQPASDAESLRRFVDECPAWRDLGTLDWIAVSPLIHLSPDEYDERAVLLSIYPVVLGIASERIPEVYGRHPDRLVRVEDLSDGVQIVRLVHAQRFPPKVEVEQALQDVDRGAWSDRMVTMGRLLVPRIIELKQPLTIDEAMRYIEQREELHHVKH